MNGTTKRSFQVMAVSMLVVLICGFALALLSTEAQAAFRFVSWADTKSSRSELSQLSDHAAQLVPVFSIYPGDLESDGFTSSGMNQWKEAMDGQLTGDSSPNGMFNKVFPVRGNHDDRNTADWQNFFDFQGTANFVGATNYTNMPGEEDLTYSFDYDNAHFIGVDVTGGAGGITSSQISWIDTDLSAAEGRGLTHAFIFFHGPIYCVDGHCSCSQRVGCIDSSVEDLIVVFNQHPIVSATFHGHEHTYAYTYLDDTRIPAEGSFEGVLEPFHQFVTGSAGAGPSSCDGVRCDYNMAKNGFVTVDVDGLSVTVTFYQLGSTDLVNTISYINEGVAPPPNNPPVASDDSASTPLQTMVTINVAVNDSDPDGNLDPASAKTTCATCAGPLNGSLVNNLDGTFDYTPKTDFTGADSFVYEICDIELLCDTATVNITVTPPNDPPVANDDSISMEEDTTVTIHVADNDSDPNGNLHPTTANSSCANGSSGCLGAANGSLIDNIGGTITYIPNEDFNGTESFVYEICDTYGLCDTATVTITIDPVPDPPTANTDSAICIEGTSVIIDVADNDNDPDGDLDLDSINTDCTGCATPDYGSLEINGEGRFVYTPDPNFNGSDSFIYEICDTMAACDMAAVSITVTPPGPTVVTFDAVSSGTTSNANMAISHTTSGSNRLMLVGVSINNDGSETVSSITYSGIPLTRSGFVNHQGSGSDDSRVEIWQLLDPPPGTADVLISFDSSLSRYAIAGVITFSGVDQSDPLGAFVSAYGDSSSASVAVPSASDELVVAVFACETCNSVSFLSPGVEEWNLAAGGGNTIGAGASIEGAGPAMSVNASLGKSDHWAMGGISIRSSGIPAPTNSPPVANDDSVTTVEDNAVLVDMAANDTDPDGNLDLGSIHETSNPSNGILTDNGGGRCTFTPNANFNGSDSFAYQICDTMGACDTAVVNITVTAVNDAPVADAQSVSTPENTGVTITLTASDVDGDSLTYSIDSGPAHGTLSGTAPNPTYTPNDNYNGTDNFTFKANDGTIDSDVATVSITVNAVNDPPVANDDTAATAEDTAVTINAAANDSDPDGILNPASTVTTAAPANGTLVNNNDGSYTFTPNTNFNGGDSFTYQICDTMGACDTATVTITVSAVNDAPVADAQSVTTVENNPVEITLTASDVDGDVLSYNVVSGPGSGTLSGTVPNLSYQPNENFNGSDSFTFTANDGIADSIEATVTITVTAVNDPPVAADDTATTAEDTAASINVAANDTDPDDNLDPATSVTTTAPNNGTLVNNGNGTFEYMPNLNFNGSDSFIYQICDTLEVCDTAAVNITVSAVNDAPVADAQSVATPENMGVTITLTGSDVDGDSLTYNLISGPGNGALSGTAPIFTYTPDTNYNGTDNFTFKANDGMIDSNVATVSITVNAVNDPPTASDNTAVTAEDTAAAITLTASDVDSDSLTYSVVTAPANGSLSGTAPNLTYTPNADYNGQDSFTFKANDGTLDSNVATISITVNAVNDAPVANADSATTDEVTAVTIDVLNNDTDVEGDSLTVSSATQGANGSVAVNADNTITYTPNTNFNGTDTFDYTASDGQGSSAATVTVTVNALPGTIHVENLQGILMPVGKKGKWKADVIITVYTSDGSPVSDATVNGTWSGSISYADSCTTDISGQCEVTSRPMPDTETTITFTVNNVTHLTLEYQPNGNKISSIQIPEN